MTCPATRTSTRCSAASRTGIDWRPSARALGLRLILDFVPNHTSEQHPWFASGERRDWYLWRDEPTNWVSVFGGPAWTWHEAAGAFYYHAYLPQQPDLNWRNPAVREAMADVLRFWVARGADGFRIDALRQTIKDDRWRDNPPNPAWREGEDPYHALLPEFTTDRPEVQDVVRLLRATVDEAAADGRTPVLIGELYLPIERLMAYYGAGLDLPANFHLISPPWEAGASRRSPSAYEAALPAARGRTGCSATTTGRGSPPRRRRAGARAAVLLLTLRGTPTLYYGDEIGMRDVPVPAERVQDPWERRVPGQGLGRDPVRTPMQWDGGPNAGFCAPGVEPWLPLADDAARSRRRPTRRPALDTDAVPRAARAAAGRARACGRLLPDGLGRRRRARL